MLGLNWQRTDCLEPENCSGTDLDADGDVGYQRLKAICRILAGEDQIIGNLDLTLAEDH